MTGVVGIVDYNAGNIRSVLNAVEAVGADAVVASDAATLADCSHIILPGVGAFGAAMSELHRRNLPEILGRLVVEDGRPFLGICLGMQLVMRDSDEFGLHQGLGWIDARVRRLPTTPSSPTMPHVGWNSLRISKAHPLLADVNPDTADFYFVHSFAVTEWDDKKDEVAQCEYGTAFCAVMARDNIMVTQFHPEKSQKNGLAVYRNFVRMN